MATAKEEIANFIASNEAGVISQYKRNTLIKAAESMFTANGLICPVQVVEVKGQTFLINRDMLNQTNSDNGNGSRR